MTKLAIVAPPAGDYFSQFLNFVDPFFILLHLNTLRSPEQQLAQSELRTKFAGQNVPTKGPILRRIVKEAFFNDFALDGFAIYMRPQTHIQQQNTSTIHSLK